MVTNLELNYKASVVKYVHMHSYIISVDCPSNYIKGKILYKYFLNENKILGKKSKGG